MVETRNMLVGRHARGAIERGEVALRVSAAAAAACASGTHVKNAVELSYLRRTRRESKLKKCVHAGGPAG